MDDPAPFLVEMHEWIWNGLKADLKDVTAEEAEWRPLPHANNISLILRHLRIEAGWHVASLDRGAPMADEVSPEEQRQIDSVSPDFQENLNELEGQYARFVALLRQVNLGTLQQRTEVAYKAIAGGRPIPSWFLGFHQATHLAMHWGQVRTLRNLYLKTQGKPARFHPQNPTYPQ
jgi:hypothetical protein